MAGAVFQKFLSLISTTSSATGLFLLAFASMPTSRFTGLGCKVTRLAIALALFLVLEQAVQPAQIINKLSTNRQPQRKLFHDARSCLVFMLIRATKTTALVKLLRSYR